MIAHKTYPVHDSPLFKLKSRKKLANSIFKVDLRYLETLASRSDNFHSSRRWTGGKWRLVECPKKLVGDLLKRLFWFLSRIEKPDYLHSGVRKRSYITNAEVHAACVPLAKIDIRKFFQSVNGARVARFFTQTLQCSPDVAGLLTRLVTFQNHLPIGACTSEVLAFFATRSMFDELCAFAHSRKVKMTCYVDNLAFSGTGVNRRFLWHVRRVMHNHGFGYHEYRCYSASETKRVTGLLLDGRRIRVLPAKALLFWDGLKALGGIADSQREAALRKLIGLGGTLGHIERRYRRAVRPLAREVAKSKIATTLPRISARAQQDADSKNLLPWEESNRFSPEAAGSRQTAT